MRLWVYDQLGYGQYGWFEKAAAQGLAGSLTTLGMMYQDGYGVEKDEEKAKEYYKKAGFDM